jgi:hypothetical protein
MKIEIVSSVYAMYLRIQYNYKCKGKIFKLLKYSLLHSVVLVPFIILMILFFLSSKPLLLWEEFSQTIIS